MITQIHYIISPQNLSMLFSVSKIFFFMKQWKHYNFGFPSVPIPRVFIASYNKSLHSLALIWINKIRQSSKCPQGSINFPYIIKNLFHYYLLFTILSLTDICWFCDSLSLIRWPEWAYRWKTCITFLLKLSPAPLTGRSYTEKNV